MLSFKVFITKQHWPWLLLSNLNTFGLHNVQRNSMRKNVCGIAYVYYCLCTDWTVYHGQQNRKESVLHRQIIRLFGDHPCDESPFSIQKLVRIGVDHGKRPGDWYGPASVAYVLRSGQLTHSLHLKSSKSHGKCETFLFLCHAVFLLSVSKAVSSI